MNHTSLFILVLVSLVLLFETVETQAEVEESELWRTWTTANGKFTVEAKLLSIANGKVKLEKRNGTTVDVKLDVLSLEDQDFIDEWKCDLHTKPKQPTEQLRQPNPAEREVMDLFKQALTAGASERIIVVKYLRDNLRTRTAPSTTVFPDGASTTTMKYFKPTGIGIAGMQLMYNAIKSLDEGEYLPSLQPPLREGAVGILRIVRAGNSILPVVIEITQVIGGEGCHGRITWYPKMKRTEEVYDDVMFKMDTGGVSDGQIGTAQNRLFRVGKPYTYNTVLGAVRTIPCLHEITLDPELVKVARAEWLKNN